MTDITPTQRAVLGLLGKTLFGMEYELPEDADIAELIRECRQQAVTAVALSGAEHPEDAGLIKTVCSAVRGSIGVLNDHTELHRLLTENGIPYVILKGAASAHYYPEPVLRTMGDVDFLVRPEELDKASALLLSEGYEMHGEEHRFHRLFTRGSTHLEAHFAFAEKINPEIDGRIDRYLGDIIDEARFSSEKYCTCMLPGIFHHGLVMLLHMQRHMLTEGLGLRHLCDWAVFAGSFAGDEFRETFREKLESIGLWRYAQIVSLAAHIGLGLPYSDYMGEDFSTAEELLEDILTSGNFGRGDKGRVNERFFISLKPENGRRLTRAGSFVRNVNRNIAAHWPKAKRHPALLLLGWLYFPLRRICLRLTKKRISLMLVRGYKKSASRKALYDKLHLFEAGEP